MQQLGIKKSSLSRYMIVPLVMTVVMLVLDIITFTINIRAGVILVIGVAVFIVLTAISYFILRNEVIEEITDYSTGHDMIQEKSLKEMPVPYALTDQSGHIFWSNPAFVQMVGKENNKKGKINDIFPDFGKKLLDKEVDRSSKYIHVLGEQNKRTKETEILNYRVELRRMRLGNVFSEDLDKLNDEEIRRFQDENTMVAMYFFDETSVCQIKAEIDNQKLVAGLIYIDNYEEVLENADEVKHSMLLTLVDRRINKLLSNLDAIVKKIEKDKYIFFFQQKYLQKLINTKFSILDDIRSINVGNEMAMTLSISLAVNCDSYVDAYETANQMMDLALGRGGDQAVIKDGENVSYYGGKSQVVEKNTRVKARVKAHALRETMETKDTIFVMGHKIPDTDSIGSAIGIYRMAKTLQKNVHIVLDQESVSVRQLLARVRADKDYEKDMIITSEKALSLAEDKNAMLVVVDVNRPSYMECEELLKKLHTVVVIDHHRRMKDSIKSATLSYIEPYASSACELVAEILQYVSTKPKLRPVEADAMYSGILIDTNNFVVQTGVRTFEAAAFLRRSGADVTRVRKIFRDSLETYQIRARAVSDSELFEKEFAIGTLDGRNLDSPSVLGAQVANQLLNIEGIKASFVLTQVDDKIFVSARSIDEINVQIIMEKLGGGGHMTVAGAQLKDMSIEGAKEVIKGLLLRMKQEGEL
ncbi:MAG: DHH family phosphoesterase [Lachnospiraceae bacterium]|nr:DHH family phosphoesterase [Lachnospiraceae bacterium]